MCVLIKTGLAWNERSFFEDHSVYFYKPTVNIETGFYSK